MLGFFHAPVGQTRAGKANLMPGTARFRPAKPGRPVLLQRRAGGQWRTAAKALQNRRGQVTVNVPTGRPGSYHRYRARAPRWHGLPAVNSPVRRAIPWERTFQDTFAARGLDKRKWTYRSLGVRDVDSDRKCAESSRRSVRVPGDGYAHLRVKKIRRPSFPERCRDGEFHNANIGTQDRYQLRYGVIAMRAKFQHQRGQHGGVWSQPATAPSGRGGAGRDGAEIDIVEYFGDGYPKGGLGHYVFWHDANDRLVKTGGIVDSRAVLGRGKTWSNSYHTYAVEWTPSRYTFLVDGVVAWRTSRGVSRVPQYIILSLLTSGWELPQLQVRKLNPMTVDWVRAWKRP